MTAADVEALQQEALATEDGEERAQGIEMTIRGITFRVGPVALWPIKAMKHNRLGEVDLALEAVLGEETANLLIDAGMTLADMERLIVGEVPSNKPKDPTMRSSAPGR